MNKFVTYCLKGGILLLVLLCSVSLQAAKKWNAADSLVEKIRDLAPYYADAVSEYEASLYVKGDLHIDRKNMLLRYLPHTRYAAAFRKAVRSPV